MQTFRQRMQRASNFASLRLVLGIVFIMLLAAWLKPPSVFVALGGVAVLLQYWLLVTKLRCPKCGQSVLAGPGANRRLRVEPQCARCNLDFETVDAAHPRLSYPA